MRPIKDSSKFLEPYKFFRDPVHGDVWLTLLETKIVDTRAFQRLGQIRQLGCAYLVYRGATHTRFSHSIGTLHSSQKLIDAINANPNSETHVDSYATLLTRLCALLHDLSHIPFGHTLEDEGNLFPPQWEDDFRVEYFLGRDSEVGNIIRNEVNDECLSDIVQILTAKSNADIENLPYPFIADMVGDTFCADFLDYSRRDSYFVGLHESLDLRLINYVSIHRPEVSHGERVILRVRNNMGRTRRDVVSEVLHLLRIRYSLMEKVIFHHTKLAASAMIIGAVYDSLINNKITKQMMCELGDEALLNKLEVDGTNLSRNLVRKLRRRELYRSTFELRYLPIVENVDVKRRKEMFRLYNDPRNRWTLERKLENTYRLPEGSIAIYCPKIKESRKSSTLMVLWRDSVFPLSELPDEFVRKEVALVEDHYRHLWKMVVFVDSKFRFSKVAKNLIDDCKAKFGL